MEAKPGATGAVLGGGGPVRELSGGSVGAEVCRSDVSVEESVELRRGAVGWSKLNAKSRRREESKVQPVKMDKRPKSSNKQGFYGRAAPDALKQNTPNF